MLPRRVHRDDTRDDFVARRAAEANVRHIARDYAAWRDRTARVEPLSQWLDERRDRYEDDRAMRVALSGRLDVPRNTRATDIGEAVLRQWQSQPNTPRPPRSSFGTMAQPPMRAQGAFYGVTRSPMFGNGARIGGAPGCGSCATPSFGAPPMRAGADRPREEETEDEATTATPTTTTTTTPTPASGFGLDERDPARFGTAADLEPPIGAPPDDAASAVSEAATEQDAVEGKAGPPRPREPPPKRTAVAAAIEDDWQAMEDPPPSQEERVQQNEEHARQAAVVVEPATVAAFAADVVDLVSNQALMTAWRRFEKAKASSVLPAVLSEKADKARLLFKEQQLIKGGPEALSKWALPSAIARLMRVDARAVRWATSLPGVHAPDLVKFLMAGADVLESRNAEATAVGDYLQAFIDAAEAARLDGTPTFFRRQVTRPVAPDYRAMKALKDAQDGADAGFRRAMLRVGDFVSRFRNFDSDGVLRALKGVAAGGARKAMKEIAWLFFVFVVTGLVNIACRSALSVLFGEPDDWVAAALKPWYATYLDVAQVTGDVGLTDTTLELFGKTPAQVARDFANRQRGAAIGTAVADMFRGATDDATAMALTSAAEAAQQAPLSALAANATAAVDGAFNMNSTALLAPADAAQAAAESADTGALWGLWTSVVGALSKPSEASQAEAAELMRQSQALAERAQQMNRSMVATVGASVAGTLNTTVATVGDVYNWYGNLSWDMMPTLSSLLPRALRVGVAGANVIGATVWLASEIGKALGHIAHGFLTQLAIEALKHILLVPLFGVDAGAMLSSMVALLVLMWSTARRWFSRVGVVDATAFAKTQNDAVIEYTVTTRKISSAYEMLSQILVEAPTVPHSTASKPTPSASRSRSRSPAARKRAPVRRGMGGHD